MKYEYSLDEILHDTKLFVLCYDPNPRAVCSSLVIYVYIYYTGRLFYADADGEETTVPVKLDEEESNIRIIEVPDIKVWRQLSNTLSRIIN